MAIPLKLDSNGIDSAATLDVAILGSDPSYVIPSNAKCSIYAMLDGSMNQTFLAEVTFRDVNSGFYTYQCGQGHYGRFGVEIPGYSDGLVWSNDQWATNPPPSDDLRVVRTGESVFELRGTNTVNYVGADPEFVRYVLTIQPKSGSESQSIGNDLPQSNDILNGEAPFSIFGQRYIWSSTGSPNRFPYRTTYNSEVAYKNVPRLLAVPLAPTITSSPSSVVPTGSSGSVSWSPSHPDLTEQGNAQVKIDSTTYDVSGSVTTYQIPSSVMGAVGSHTVSVRTQNSVDQSWGAWSTPITFQVRDLPTITVTSPTRDYVLSDLPLVVSWDTSDVTGISQQRVEILNSLGSTVWQTSVAVGTMNVAVGRDQYYLESGQAYSVRVTVTNGVNLSSSVTVPFTVLYVGPANPEVTVSQGTGCSMSVSVDFVESSGKPDVDTADVYRVDQFGDQTLLGTVSESGGSVLDVLPPLNVDFSYRIVVFAASGASTAITTEARVDSGGMEAWNFGPSASTALLLGLNASGSRSTQFSGETFHFALGPGTPALPTFYPDGDLDATGSHSYVVHGVEDYLRVRSVVEDPNSAVCWFRDAFGGRHTVHASWQTGYDASSYDLFTVTASATEVVWEEPTI